MRQPLLPYRRRAAANADANKMQSVQAIRAAQQVQQTARVNSGVANSANQMAAGAVRDIGELQAVVNGDRKEVSDVRAELDMIKKTLGQINQGLAGLHGQQQANIESMGRIANTGATLYKELTGRVNDLEVKEFMGKDGKDAVVDYDKIIQEVLKRMPPQTLVFLDQNGEVYDETQVIEGRIVLPAIPVHNYDKNSKLIDSQAYPLGTPLKLKHGALGN